MATRKATAGRDRWEPGPRPARWIELGAAISEIRQACEESGPDSSSSPYFLIVGAGISFPPVPLSATIIDHCKEVATRYKRTGEPRGGSTLDAYSHWFDRAYPHPFLRQRYLRSLIENQPLSVASLRLAHLLSARKLTNLVVTTNFDDFVERALRLFGEEPAVCDHPRTIARIDSDSQDLQIAHVHGSYLFYDCANLTGEVTGRAQADEETSLTIVGLLDGVLWNRSPLVIGYSGWEGDVVMSALRRRLRGGGLPQSIYWFAHRASEVERLPGWLRDSPDVRFVVPARQEPGAETARRAKGRSRGDDSGAGGAPDEPTLPAREVFDKLNQAFDIGEPTLFEDPLEYFAQHLERSLPGGDDRNGGPDPYAFRALIQSIRAAGGVPASRGEAGLDGSLKDLREAMRASDYAGAVEILDSLVPARLGQLRHEDERQEVLGAAQLAGKALLEEVKREGELVGSVDEATLARILSVDDSLARQSGVDAPLVAVFPARSGEYNYEGHSGGAAHGLFTYSLAESLVDPEADADGDGRISIQEAVVAAGAKLIRAGWMQTPVVVGDGSSIALFAARAKAAAKAEKGRLVAMLVGVSEYQKIPRLRGPANDVPLMAKLLEQGHRDRFLYREAEVLRYQDEEATVAGVRSGLHELASKVGEDDLALFYFSGHSTYVGWKEGEFLLALHESESPSTGMLAFSELLDALDRLGSKQTLALFD